jgi:hypothetical protein
VSDFPEFGYGLDAEGRDVWEPTMQKVKDTSGPSPHIEHGPDVETMYHGSKDFEGEIVPPFASVHLIVLSGRIGIIGSLPIDRLIEHA